MTISFNLAPGRLARRGDRRRVDRTRRAQTLPATITATFQGTAQAFQSVAATASACCWSLAVLVIYLVLGILYESFIHPLTILSGLPSAGFGALVTLLLFRQELNIYALSSA